MSTKIRIRLPWLRVDGIKRIHLVLDRVERQFSQRGTAAPKNVKHHKLMADHYYQELFRKGLCRLAIQGKSVGARLAPCRMH